MKQELLKKIFYQTESYLCPMTKAEFALAHELRVEGLVQQIKGVWSLTKKGFTYNSEGNKDD